jgi:hypothetical protein
MRFILWLVLVSIPVHSLLAKDILYFIRGNIIDRHSHQHLLAEKILENFMQENYPEVIFKNIHNHKWESVCRNIRNEKINDPSGKVILIGHSWGAQVSMSIARCLKRTINLKVDHLISIDPIKKPFHIHVSLVPTAIGSAISYHQNRDRMLRGNKNLYWVGINANQKNPIENIFIHLESSHNAHDMVLYKLMLDGVIQNHIDDYLND